MTETNEINLLPNWEVKPPVRQSHKRPPILVTVNELNQFKRCPRDWDISSPTRRSLRKKGTPSPPLIMGSAMHYAIDEHSKGRDPLEAIRLFYEDKKRTLNEQYIEIVGTPMSDEEFDELDQQCEQCIPLIRAYFDRYGWDNPVKPYVMVGNEITFRIPLVLDQGVYLVGTVDRAVTDTEQSVILPVETKTYSRRPDKEAWRFNNQIYGYGCALQILTHKTVPYGLYDGIHKTEAIVPKILKNGNVSKAWIDTSYGVYRNRLLEVYGTIPNEYLDILNRLKVRDSSSENAFTTRFRIPVSQYAIARWWEQAKLVATEIANTPKIWPLFTRDGCKYCDSKLLCYAIQSGDSNRIRYLLDNVYEKQSTPTRMATEYVTPDKVHSISELKAWCDSRSE